MKRRKYSKRWWHIVSGHVSVYMDNNDTKQNCIDGFVCEMRFSYWQQAYDIGYRCVAQ